MKTQNRNRLLCVFRLVVFGLSTYTGCLAAQGTLLKYRFRPEEILMYKTDSQDSVSDGKTVRLVFQSRLDQMRVEKIQPDQSAWIILNTDSAWSSAVSNRESDPLAVYSEAGRIFTDEKIQLTESGAPLQSNKGLPPFVIPLSEKPVSENASWDFETRMEFNKPFSGKKNTTGHCFLFGIVRENNRPLAVLMFRMETRLLKKWKLMEPFQSINFVLEENWTHEGAAYLDTEGGRMYKMAFASKTYSVLKADRTTYSRTVSSRTNIRLINEP